MIYTQESLYQLSPQEFEALCAKAITQILPDITEVELVGPSHKEVRADIIGKLHNEPVAIEVKHKLRITSQEIQRIFDNLIKNKNNPKHVVLMSSALLKDIQHHTPISNPKVGVTYHYIGANDILEVINSTDIKPTELIEASERVRGQNYRLVTTSIYVLIVIFMLGKNVYDYWKDSKESTLANHITSVEKSIENLKDLEQQLQDIKNDMVATEKARIVIEQNYHNAQVLEKLSNEQLSSIKGALQTQSWIDIAIQTFFAFLLGILSNMAWDILRTKYKHRQELE